LDSNNIDITEELDSPSVFCGNPVCLGELWCSAWGICKDITKEASMASASASLDLDEDYASIEEHDLASQQLESSLH